MFNAELMSLLGIMRDSAVFQFRMLQKNRERFFKFGQRLKEFFRLVDLEKAPHLFINPRTDRLCIVMFTSDEGFMGGLNLQVINSSLIQPGADAAKLIIVGERGQRYLEEMRREFIAFSTGGGKVTDYAGRYDLALKLRDCIMNGIKEGQFGRVIVSYPKCLSFLVQKVEVIEILPVGAAVISERNHSPDDVIIESPLEGIIKYLVEELVLDKLMGVLEDSKLAEFAARAIHLEKSNRELDEKEKNLQLQYFHAYHKIIDTNIRELFAAQIIRRGK